MSPVSWMRKRWPRQLKILSKVTDSKRGALLILPRLHSAGEAMVAQRRKTFAHSHEAS